MKKLFISQPMNGKTDEQILLERSEAINRVKEKLKEVVELNMNVQFNMVSVV